MGTAPLEGEGLQPCPDARFPAIRSGRDYLKSGADLIIQSPEGARNLHERIPVLFSIFLVSVIILGGCIVPVPVPVPVPMPTPIQSGQQALTGIVTPSETMPEAASTTTVPTETPIPAPVLTPVFMNPLPRGTAYTFTDNMDFHTLSVKVGSCQVRTKFYFTPGTSITQLTPVEPIPGLKFLMVGVDFHMTGIRKEGKSSLFMTPLATSFQLVKGGDSYRVLNASEITGMTDYYIHDVGSIYRDRFIDKVNDGSGVLIFVVPQSFDPTGAFVTFCPRNLESWASSGYYRSPDNWDCERNLVVWQLR